MSSDIRSIILWRDVWAAIRGADTVARTRATRETLIVVVASLAPFFLGALFSYVREQREPGIHHGFWQMMYTLTLEGQLFLLFLSLAGTIFARLWDSDGPKYQFTAYMSLFHIIGGAIAAGLLAIDPASSTFSFFPAGALSLFFFVAVILNYFLMAVPGYLRQPDLQESTNKRSDDLTDDLQARMG